MSDVSKKTVSAIADEEQREIHAVEPEPESEGFSLIKQVRLWEMYAAMLKCRMTADAVASLRNLSLATLLETMGWEAAVAAVAVDLHTEDGLSLTTESVLAALVKGARLEALLTGPRNSAGQKSAMLHGLGVGVLPPEGGNAARLHTACGVAMAHKMRRSGRVVVAFMESTADAVTSNREALAFCGRHELPMVLVDLHATQERESLVQEGDERLARFAHGVPAITVDGSDVVAVYRVASEALGRARLDRGATLIECLGPKHEATKAWRNEGQPHDPIEAMEAYLGAKGIFREKRKNEIAAEFRRELEAALGISPKKVR